MDWKLERKDWESEFFKKEILKLTYSGVEYDFEPLFPLLKENAFDIVEYNLDIRDIGFSHQLEKIGFSLVDSRMTFITKISKDQYPFRELKLNYEIRMFRPSDQESIKRLTKEFLNNTNTFNSRYSNTYYFEDPESDKKYFTKWIYTSIEDPKSMIAVALMNGEVVGYFIYKESGVYEGYNLYKGILCSVKKEHQGKKLHLFLQDYIFTQINSEVFYIDNTTQLSNISVIKNHIRSQRKLDSSFLTFMLKKSDLRPVNQ